MTRNDFQSIYDQGPEATFALVQSLLQSIASLSARVKELEDRLNKDSHNSSKPPSSDGLGRKPRVPKSLRQKSGRRSGGQPGHPGTTLCLSEEPEHLALHAPDLCSCCGASLEQVPAHTAGGFERRQVYDLPLLSLEVTEHRALCKTCPACHRSNHGAFPTGVSQPVQYGPRLKALCVYLQHYQLLPFERTQQLLFDLFGTSLSEGTLANALVACHEALAPVESAIKHSLTKAPVLHFDETGARIENKLGWLHTASTDSLTFYALHPKRGRAALDAIGILPAYSGTAMHDAFRSYFGYAGCVHALCNAHLLRELIALAEQSQQAWPSQMIELILEIKQAVDTSKTLGNRHLQSACLKAFEARYQALIAQGSAANPAPSPSGKRGPTKQSAAKNLLDRLDVHRGSVLTFMYHFEVPFDNNLAERDLRMMKVRQKVSGCFRSQEGAAMFCRIRGYISTLRKQGKEVLSALQSVFTGDPYMPVMTALTG
jgi:transposase